MPESGYSKAEKELQENIMRVLESWVQQVNAISFTLKSNSNPQQILNEFNACSRMSAETVLFSENEMDSQNVIELTHNSGPLGFEFCHPRVQKRTPYPSDWPTQSMESLEFDIHNVLEPISALIRNQYHDIVRLFAYMFDCAFASHHPGQIYENYLKLASRIIQCGHMSYKNGTLYIHQ